MASKQAIVVLFLIFSFTHNKSKTAYTNYTEKTHHVEDLSLHTYDVDWLLVASSRRSNSFFFFFFTTRKDENEKEKKGRKPVGLYGGVRALRGRGSHMLGTPQLEEPLGHRREEEE